MSDDSASGQRGAQKAETRARILRQAKQLCARRGFHRTKTLDVAKAARVSHGAVFVHFPSREDLMSAVIAEMAREITDALHEQVTQGGSLRDVLAAHLACVEEREDQIRWLLIEGPTLPAGFNSAWVGLQSAVSHYIAQAAEREMAEKRVRSMPVHLLFNTWVGLLHHYVVNRDLFAPKGSVVRVHGVTLLDHFMDLVRNPTKGNSR